jgi:RNA recognition motif-containing protein
MTNIFIANLDWEITSDDLTATFSSFGVVTYAHVVFEKDTKRSRGYGYVEMEDTDNAINAIQALNGMEINGRKLDVKIASPKGNRPPKKEVVEKKPFEKKPFEKRPFNNDRRFDSRNQNREGNRPYQATSDRPKRNFDN